MKQQCENSENRRAFLYANGSFDNKGCEAIIRGANKVLSEASVEVSIGTNALAVDERVAEELNIKPVRIPRSRESFLGIVSEVCRRARMRRLSVAIPFVQLKKLRGSYDYSFSMGGDNYCYDGQERFYRMNKSIRCENSRNFFWGCSLEEKYYDDMMKADLEGYDVIFARESRTYRMLLNKGFTNVIKCTDPAFLMEKEECAFPDGTDPQKKYIGFNISPLTLSCNSDPDKMFEYIVCAIKKVLEQTEYDILMIPHVYGHGSDYDVHCRIAEAIGNDRIKLVKEEYNAPQLKYIISRCEAFIGSRTHATIAAYSTCVPTLVMGYSIKSVGIAEDLFGVSDGYVIKVQDELTYDILEDSIMRLIAEKDRIKEHLRTVMEEYIKDAYVITEVIKNEQTAG